MENRYEKVRELGSGGTGSITLVYDHFIHRYVAFKELNSSKDEWINQSLQRECHMLGMLEHERIPRILDCIQLREKKFMVMEYVEGINLKELVTYKGVLTEEHVIHIGIQICEILRYLHTHRNKVLYLDLKPQNLMLMKNEKIKLIDFGSAREMIVESTFNKEMEMRVGTYGYAAPELLLPGRGTVTERTDVYGLGATLFYLITGIDPAKPPYEIKQVREWNSMVSYKMEQIIETCTKKAPEERFQNMEELLVEFKKDKKVRTKIELLTHINKCIKTKTRFFLKQEKNIFCSEKKIIGLFGILLCVCYLFNFTAKEKLLVNIRNEINQKLLIQEGSIYYTRESILFEVPKQQMTQEQEYEFTIISKNLNNGQEKERKFLIVSQSEEENRECIENIRR